MKYILVPLVKVLAVVLVSAAFAEFTESEALKSNGAATAADPTETNFLLVRFRLDPAIGLSPIHGYHLIRTASAYNP
jgi:hypothetical protein